MSTAELAAPETDTPAAPRLVARLVEQNGAQWVRAANLDAFAAAGGDRVLFFSGDPVRFPECLDVAAVLPQLQGAFPGRFSVGVVVPAEEDAVARRYGVQRWPSLVFVRDGRYVATVAGMLDWADYVAAVARALEQPATRAPTIGIAVVSADGGPSCH